MNIEEWRRQWDDRVLRYPDGRVLDPNRWVLLRADVEHAARYDGQVAILTAANLLGRTTPSVALDIPELPVVSALPWAGSNLRDLVITKLHEADPHGGFQCRPSQEGDYVIDVGSPSGSTVIHGSGWDAYVGRTPSPIGPTDQANPIGPALAAIIAVAQLSVHSFRSVDEPVVMNGLDWTHVLVGADAPMFPPHQDLGALWSVGVGSVGTAILYFLTLATSRFISVLFDMDRVKVTNLSRSPTFVARDVGDFKVHSVERYLRSVGVTDISAEACALDEKPLWRNREEGTPDVLISAANERNARFVAESGFPPTQIYGTTGQNWQASVIRHVPLVDPCSCCLFPVATSRPMACATGKVTTEIGEHVDAALPFLSFAAGLMAAAEILKRGLPGYPFSCNRVTLNTRPNPRLVPAALTYRAGCICRRRSPTVHRQMLGLPPTGG